MTLEDRLKYIRTEYGEDVENLWKQIAQLPNFKEELLTDDKLFMCITQRGLMSPHKRIGLVNRDNYKSYFKGNKDGKITYTVSEVGSRFGEDREQSFCVSIDDDGYLVFEGNVERLDPKYGDILSSEHEIETIGINNEGNIEYLNESEERQKTSDTTIRIIKGKELSKYDRETGIKVMTTNLTSEERKRDGKVSYFDGLQKTSKLNPDYATVTSTTIHAELVDGEMKAKKYNEVYLYPGEYIPMDDFDLHGYLEKPGRVLVTPETPKETIDQHRIKLAEEGLKHIGKLPIQLINQLPDDIKRNIQGYEKNMDKPEVSAFVYKQIYDSILEKKKGPEQMHRMTGRIQSNVPTKDNRKEGQDIND